MKVLERIALFLVIVAALCRIGEFVPQAMAAPEVKPAVTLYRIRTEQGLQAMPGADLTTEDVLAIQRFNRLLAKWPDLLWMTLKDGQLVAVKIDPATGKPARIK